MKYTINGFNQEIAIQLELDSDDLLILRWFVDFAGTQKMIKEVVDGQPYYWIKYEAVLENLPILKIKSDTLFRRIKKMVKVGVLNQLISNKKGKTSLYGFGPNYDALISKSAPIIMPINNEKHSEINPSKKSADTRKNIRTYPEKNPSEYSEKNPDPNNILLKENSSNNNYQSDSQSEIMKFYLTVFKEKSQYLAINFEDYTQYQMRLENIIDQISISKVNYNINDAELTPLQVLREIQYIFARQYDEAYKLIEDIFTKVDAEPNIHNKFKYTVAMLYNTARGT